MGLWALGVLAGGCTDFVSAQKGSSDGPHGTEDSGSTSVGDATTDDTTSGGSASSPTTQAATSSSSGPGAVEPSSSSSSGGELDPSGASSSSSTTGDEEEPDACRNGSLDPGEVDTDCGGPCPACAAGAQCFAPADCTSGSCLDGACGAETLVIWLDATPANLYADPLCTTPIDPVADDSVACWANLGAAGDAVTKVPATWNDDADTVGVDVAAATFVIDSPFADGVLGEVFIAYVSTEVNRGNAWDFNLNHPDMGGNRYSAHLPWSSGILFFDPSIGARIESVPNVSEVGDVHMFTMTNSISQAVRELRLDGAVVASAAMGFSAPTSDFGLGQAGDKRVHEMRVYDPAPPLEVRQLIEGELACKWAVRDQLPEDHPYYNPNGGTTLGCPE
ncbi:MAG: hypothetical protein AAGA54_03745 [Myxococcota bacterium]